MDPLSGKSIIRGIVSLDAENHVPMPGDSQPAPPILTDTDPSISADGSCPEIDYSVPQLDRAAFNTARVKSGAETG